MKLPDFIPSSSAIARETLIVLCGALLAAVIMSQWPAGRDFIKKAWSAPYDPPKA